MSLQSKLTPLSSQYEYEDESGYAFKVTTSFDEERGWKAHVAFICRGMATEEAAIEHLLNPVEHFARVAKEK